MAVDENDKVIGASLAFPCNNGAYDVHKVFVAKEHQGKGIGTELIKILIDKLQYGVR